MAACVKVKEAQGRVDKLLDQQEGPFDVSFAVEDENHLQGYMKLELAEGVKAGLCKSVAWWGYMNKH